MRISLTLVGALLASAIAVPGISSDFGDLPDSKKTKAGLYLTSEEAFDMLKDDNVLLLDVRSRPELIFVGHPSRMNTHIPFMIMPEEASYNAGKKTYNMVQNSNFEFDFLDYAEANQLPDEKPILIICRSGSRSARAADMIYDLGFTNVYSIVDGFEGDKAKDGPEKGHRVVNGWKNAGLEWTYAVTPEQAYPADN
ncbi:rhodanese-like domain-containing protein [Actibacterium pelagium]|uniref:Rhodanese domain-containing protein n=1 Tax=Actibacterium pelagium TaxID=2029103 RepID=A0A917ACV8_9RHOB|nr:rhodanese-like domain-containing protein [Actibacterium pelagium]GGE39040.1 hypothetical protein GCM10011517_03490 [Actibacterium pelagium]